MPEPTPTQNSADALTPLAFAGRVGMVRGARGYPPATPEEVDDRPRTSHGSGTAPSRPATAVDFDACLKTLQARAHGEGIAEPIVRDVLPKLQQQPRVLELDRQQPEFSQTLAAYLNARAGERRVAQGRRLLREQRPFLAALTKAGGEARQV